MTAIELIAALAKFPPDTEVCLGLCDDEVNAAGGYFGAIEEVVDFTDDEQACVQLTFWRDITCRDCGATTNDGLCGACQ